MNKIRSFFTLLLLMIGLCLSTLQAQSYNSLWKQVEQAQKKSLPQTVVKLTGQIYRKAEQEKNVMPQRAPNTRFLIFISSSNYLFTFLT